MFLSHFISFCGNGCEIGMSSMIRIILQNWRVIYDMATCVNEGA